MMAAFGFVEIAYKEKPDEGATSYYDTLAYVRLTNLGLYALDIKKRCKPMKAPKKKYSLLQIPTDDKELQHIILTAPYHPQVHTEGRGLHPLGGDEL